MPNGDGRTPLWQTFVSQLPWVIGILAGGAWYMAKQDARSIALEIRMGALESAMVRVEARQERQEGEKLQDLQEEVARLRRTVSKP